MAELVRSKSLTDGWLDAVRSLLASPGREVYDLVVEMAEPQRVDDQVRTAVDRYLVASGRQRVGTVASTIFPSRLAARSADRVTLYRRYERLQPRIARLDRRNGRGTYFGRMIRFPLQPDATRSNQLERVITDLGQVPHRRMKHIYEVQVFAPGRDLRPEGFPCLSSLSFHLEGGCLRLAATYRNQYYMERGLGNFVGLAQLQRYVADQAGLPTGALSVHAFHAKVEDALRDVRPLLEACARVSQAPGEEG